MAFEVTATKKRPNRFAELAGQDFVVKTLANALSQGRIAPAYLFSGPRGVGKTSAARLLAKALNCENGPTAEPCGTCANCTSIAAGNSLDVFEIDGASNTSVNDVREIKDEVLFAPNSSKYKVYIIDEVHMLSNSAFNALLKTIEEPPPYVVFIFATTEIHKVPATIKSRCQQFQFRLIGLDMVKQHLASVAGENGVQADDDALFWIAKESTGSLRDAYTLYDQVVSFSQGHITLEKIRNTLGLVGLDALNSLVETCARGDSGQATEALGTILAGGVAVEQVVRDLADYFRAVLFVKAGITRESILGTAADRFPQDVVAGFTPFQLEQALNLLLDLYRNIRYSLDPRWELELAVNRLCRLSAIVSQNDLVERLERLGNGILAAPAAQVGNPESPAPAAEPVPASSGEDLGQKIVDDLRKKHVALSAALDKALVWTIRGDEMHVVFPAPYHAELVQKEQNVVREALSRLSESPLSLSIDVEGNPGDQSDSKSQVDMVKDVFKGQIVGGTE